MKVKSSRTFVAIFAIMILFTTPILVNYHPAFATASTGVMIPLYSYPGSYWTQVIQAKNAHPSVPIVVIINPNNGPGSSIDSNYVNGIQQLQAAGITVLGYVYTSYGARSISSIEADINSYNSWYHVTGINFDEMSNISGFETYYSNLSNYAKSLGMTLTVGNPGTDTLSSYVGTVDVLDIYENPGLPALSDLTGWHTSYPKSNFAFVAFGVSSLPSQSTITTDSSYVEYMYITNDVLSNPYDTVPSYLSTEVGMLDTGSTSPTAPGSPTGLTSTTVSSSQINLSWTIPSSNGGSVITGYKIERSTDSGTTWSTIVANTASTTTTYSNTGLSPSTTYTYRVSAINNAGTSSPSNTASVTTNPISSITQVTISVKSADLSGKPITGMSTVIRYTNGTTIASGFTPVSFTITSGTTYVVHVRNYLNDVFNHWQDGSTNSYYTIAPTQNAVLTAYYSTGTTTAIPSAPQNLKATGGNTIISLLWAAPTSNGGSSITGYKIYRSTSSGTETLLATLGNVTSYNDSTVTNGQTYFYKVSDLNSVGESTLSNEASATPVAPATVSSSPSGLTATTISSSQINLSWTIPSSNGGSVITGYKIERSTDSGTTWSTIVANTASTTTTYSNTGLSPSTTYTYRVSAINSVGTSLPSNTASATTSSGTIPSSIVLNGIQTTSGTVSSSPYQITLSNFNVGTANNRLLVVGVDANNNAVASITFGGVPLTRSAHSFTNNDAEFWYLKNPAGTGNIIVTMTGSTSVVVGAYSFFGVDQTTPIPTSVTNHNTASSSPIVSITTKYANSWVLDSPSIYGGVTLGSPTCTQQWNAHIASAITGASSSTTKATAGSVTCSWTASGGGDLWDDAAIEIKASG